MVGFDPLANLERARRAARARAAARAVLVAAVTAKDAQLSRCLAGEVEELDTFHAHTPVAPPYSGIARSGESRETNAELVARQLRVAMRRMLSELSDLIAEYAGCDPCIVIGGAPAAVAMVVELLPASLEERVYVDAALRIPPTAPDLCTAADRGAAAIRDRQEQALVATVLDAAASRGHGMAGRDGVEHALELGAVRALVLSRTFVERDPPAADALARRAAAQGASVEEIDGAARARLDGEGEGIAALLDHALASP